MKKISQRERKKQPKVRTVKTEMTGKRLTIHAGLLPVMNFMNKLGFWNKVKNEVHAERAPNARQQFSDVTNGRPSPTRFEIAEGLSSSRSVEDRGAEYGQPYPSDTYKTKGQK